MPRLSISSGARGVSSPMVSMMGDFTLLQKSKLKYLEQLGPFFFVHTVDKLSKYYGRNRRLCLISNSLLAGACASSGKLSFCIRVEDIAELITDTKHLAVGVRVRDSPFRSDAGRNLYTDMPVDVLIFAPTPAVLHEFTEVLTRVHGTRTAGQSLSVRERDPMECFTATLTLQPEGRRVRKFAPLAAGNKVAPPASPLFSRTSRSVSAYPPDSPLAMSRDAPALALPLRREGSRSFVAAATASEAQCFLPQLRSSPQSGLPPSQTVHSAKLAKGRPKPIGVVENPVFRFSEVLQAEPSSSEFQSALASRVTSPLLHYSDLDTENG